MGDFTSNRMHVLVAHDSVGMTCYAARMPFRRNSARAKALLLRRAADSRPWRSLRSLSLRLCLVGSRPCSLVSPGGVRRMVPGAARLQSLRPYLHLVTRIYSTKPSRSLETSSRHLQHRVPNLSSTTVPPQPLKPQTPPCHRSHTLPRCTSNWRRPWKRRTSQCLCRHPHCRFLARSPRA